MFNHRQHIDLFEVRSERFAHALRAMLRGHRGQSSGPLVSEPQGEIATQRISPDGLDGAIGLAGMILFASARGLAQADPVGGTIAGPLEALCIDKGLEPIDGMTVKSLPVAGNDPGTLCQ